MRHVNAFKEYASLSPPQELDFDSIGRLVPQPWQPLLSFSIAVEFLKQGDTHRYAGLPVLRLRLQFFGSSWHPRLCPFHFVCIRRVVNFSVDLYYVKSAVLTRLAFHKLDDGGG